MKKIKKTMLGIGGIVLACAIAIPTFAITLNNTTNLVATDQEQDNLTASYTTVTFANGGDEEISFQGANKSRAKIGKMFASVKKPTPVHARGLQFKYWSESKDNPQPINNAKIINGPLTVYPVFQDRVLLANCLGMSIIENTTITFNKLGTSEPNLQYSTSYGERWDNVTNPISLNSGDTIYFRGENPEGFNTDSSNYSYLSFSQGSQLNIAGNIMGLLDNGNGTNHTTIPNSYCFYHLFSVEGAGYSAIRNVSDTFLPATELTQSCYEGLFNGCTDLLSAPSLPATNISPTNVSANNCYKELFKNCSLLDYIKISYDGNFNSCFTNWVSGVASTGSIVYSGNDTTTSDSAIPNGWIVNKPITDLAISCDDADTVSDNTFSLTLNHPYQFVATVQPAQATANVTWTSSDTTVAFVNPTTGVVTGIKNGECTIVAHANDGSGKTQEQKIKINSIIESDCVSFTAKTGASALSWEFIGEGTVPQFKYSFDLVNWLTLKPAEIIEIPQYATLKVKGDNYNGLTPIDDEGETYVRFMLGYDDGGHNGLVDIGGNVMGLLDDARPTGAKSDQTKIPSNYCFSYLFRGETEIRNVSETFLPATNLSKGCYVRMFQSCTSLLQAPNLPATDLSGWDQCYYSMFRDCDSLETPPELPATTLSPSCYSAMFYDCDKLKTTPELEATTAADSCYYMMFQYCKAIEQVGYVHLETLADNACLQMFDVTKASTIKFGKASGTSWTKIFVCPSTTGLTDPVFGMFMDVSIGETKTPTAGESWYYSFPG